jgi:hypothetical protein
MANTVKDYAERLKAKEDKKAAEKAAEAKPETPRGYRARPAEESKEE